jgi:hypothetical protein
MSPGERCDAILKMIDEGLEEGADCNAESDDGVPGSQPGTAAPPSSVIKGAQPLDPAA